MSMARRWANSVLVAVIATGSIAAGPRRPRDPVTFAGDTHFQAGRYNAAVVGYTSVLERLPDHPGATYGLGLSLARLGRCAEAAELLDRVRAKPVYKLDGYLIEGECSLQQGDRSGAIERFEEATWRFPKNASAWYQLLVARWVSNDVEGALDAFDTLSEVDRKGFYAATAAVRLQLGTDDFAAAWVRFRALADALEDPAVDALAVFLESRQLLLDGSPEAAMDRMMLAIRTDYRNRLYASWRAEACRRAGDLDCATFALERPAMQDVDTLPITLAIEARVDADKGRFDDALAALAAHPDPGDPDWVASRWYVARRAGEDTGRWEAMYAVVRRTDCDPLERLVPRGGESLPPR